ncbi:probable C-mannosyltransferase DPY19L1 [Bicyclus anynana]|uniref:Probable C-mannosyltransferase DPY19L1 n=1 Tax=Bicyclus anynana TaxID=110368 RepID=A0A6J1NX18_BICAN|nr:probable C-mannosyltransferase DPY19L1 [Bicyclus anynana]
MEENTTEAPIITTKRSLNSRIFYGCIILLLAIALGSIHYVYVSQLFENDRNFSHLSDLEREMSLRTEMGFYYSYYKTIVQEKPYIAGIYKLFYDKLVEYPKEVNAFNRFNIHPEVLIGSVYRYFEQWLTTNHKECHMVDRGEGRTPVKSCVGVGVPVIFYLEAIWGLAGVTVAALFLHATVLSTSILGGALAVLQYFANHAECTRVQWAPNERENFALPFLLLQGWLQTLQLRARRTAFHLQLPILLLNSISLLFWQFTPFIFLTQTAIFFVMEQLKIIDAKFLFVFIHNHFCSLHSAAILLQGNDMLKSSLHTCYFFVITVYCLIGSYTRIKVENRVNFYTESFLVVLRLCITILAAFYLRNVFGDTNELQDAHVWDILYSKFTDYKSFHTLIYTCSEVFDFLPVSSIVNMSKTLLVPFVVIVFFNVINFWMDDAYNRCEKEVMNIVSKKEKDDEDSGIENTEAVRDDKKKSIENVDVFVLYMRSLKIEPALFYNLCQMVVYGVMAALVMRLKLLFSTQMCIVSSLVMTSRFHIVPKCISKYINVLWVYAIVIVPILMQLAENVKQEMSHVGEFSDFPQEELLEWISKESAVGAFAGSMPVLATVLLTTRRPVVAHPHYEHDDARQRAYAVYKVYGKFSSQHYYQEMTRLKATHLILEPKYCYGKSGKGCSFEYIWDVEVPALKSNPKLCHVLLTEPVEHFYPVFKNEHYTVFRIYDVGVQYMPRTFST